MFWSIWFELFFSHYNDFKGCMKIFQEGNKEFEIQNLFKLKPTWKLALLYNEAFFIGARGGDCLTNILIEQWANLLSNSYLKRK